MAKNKTMPKVSLTNIAGKIIESNSYITEIANYDYTSFTRDMSLFDYQEQALKQATALLCRYFDQHAEVKGIDYLVDEYRLLSDYPLEDLSISHKDKLYPLLANYFESDKSKLDYKQLLNRMCFWMATGSGKTIVMVKLIATMAKLMQDGLIPTKPIMILAPDENILKQIKQSVAKYNLANKYLIDLRDLKQSWEVDNSTAQIDMFDKDKIKVYYYKSNNLVENKADTAKDKNNGKNIYFDNYRNLRGWYLFLDEAHRGDNDSSNRKAIFNILAQNGFLFNFSATFTDDIDILTTLYDMNLAKFLQAGYGKKLYISQTEIGDLGKTSNENLLIDQESIEKQKTIAKTILFLALQRKNATQIRQIKDTLIYHMPLMLVLAGQVNSEDKGLKPFFSYLIKLVKNQWDITTAKTELKQELKTYGISNNFKFGLGNDTDINHICNQINSLTINDIWQYVFGGTMGNIEVITYEKNKNEVAFKLKTADKPFALLVIGEAISWLKNDTSGVFEITNRSLDESLFKNINKANHISMLLGSQMFKEGWDSNRPNIVCYLGVGKNSDNKKYVMQTIGRGIRIEPFSGQRKRFEYCNSDSLSIEQSLEIKQLAPVIETEFVFATDSKVINEIWDIIKTQGDNEIWNTTISKNFNINKNLPAELIIPSYKKNKYPNNDTFYTSKQNKENLQEYISSQVSNKVLALKHNLNVRIINKLKGKDSIKVSNSITNANYKVNVMIELVAKHFNSYQNEISGLVQLNMQIKHYEHIATTLTDNDLQQLELELKQIMQNDSNIIDESILLEQLKTQQISTEEYIKKAEITRAYNNELVSYKIINTLDNIKQLFKHHYYQPLIIVNNNYQNKFKHLIRVKSEIEFITNLCNYATKLNNKYEWWYFTKVDESLDYNIGIDYFDASMGRTRKFYPDFIFWLKQKNTGKLIVKFIDPKGGEHQNITSDKITGFEKMFAKYLSPNTHQDYEFNLHFYNQDIAVTRSLDSKYKKYWYDNLDNILLKC